jgi:hypothetical protein
MFKNLKLKVKELYLKYVMKPLSWALLITITFGILIGFMYVFKVLWAMV